MFRVWKFSQLGRFDGHPLVCGFFKSGRTCMAGATCPFAHKVPRVFDSRTGLDNPKTVELLARNVYMGPVDPPLDQTLKTLYLRRLNSSVHEQHIRDRFNPYGEIKSIVYFAMRGVDGAFLTYTTREGAEKAMLEHSSWVVINGQNVKLLWGAHVIPKEAVVQENDQPQDHDRDVSRILIH
ncbi:zinc finger CCCH domain-containing protein 25 isoform X2 [Brassica napus]|uniref:zinc finger CCCH domain-containing protein 25 isoform X2 n=1 Tax=Brassica napus TaxID=3708 RepID=UPI0004F16A01|nr:zinc finger CCCH domain-containing protein 25 isoform X2 [Brassica napus]